MTKYLKLPEAQKMVGLVGRPCIVKQQGSEDLMLEKLWTDENRVRPYKVRVTYEQPWAGIIVGVQSVLDEDGQRRSWFLVADEEGQVFEVRSNRLRLCLTYPEIEWLEDLSPKLPRWDDLKAQAIEAAKQEHAEQTQAVADWRASQAKDDNERATP